MASAIPVDRRISSSVRRCNGDGSRALDRTQLRSVQTPQCFHTGLLRKAFEQPYDPAFTDEATLVERLGVTVHLVEGEEHNIKVTTPLDLQFVEVAADAGVNDPAYLCAVSTSTTDIRTLSSRTIKALVAEVGREALPRQAALGVAVEEEGTRMGGHERPAQGLPREAWPSEPCSVRWCWPKSNAAKMAP